MKKSIAIVLLTLVMLMLAACGGKAAPAPAETQPTQETQAVETTQATEAPTQPTAPLEYAGIYCRTWSEEIAGTVAERNSYYILNPDHTGYLVMQAVGTLTWDENQLTDHLGGTYSIALTQENGIVNLLVYEFQDTPSVYKKIEKLPDEINALIAEEAIHMRRDQEFSGVYCRTVSEEIGGTVTERKSYIVLNEGGTGYWAAQDIGEVTWNENQLTDNLGMTYSIALIEENGTDNLLVYEFPDNPSVFVRIEQLPAEIENLIAAG